MVNERQSWFKSVSAVCAIVFATIAAPARADEVWVTPTYQQDIGGLGIASNGLWPVTAVGAVRLVLAVPNNLQTFQSAKVALIPGSVDGASSLNILVCAAQHSDLVGAACTGTPSSQAFTGAANQLVEVEIGSLPAFTSRLGTPGANYLAILAYTTPTALTDHIVGLRFSYTPNAPAGVAMLSANTFTGTQTAPGFVGDGSRLTNLPVPGGAATLGANTFSGAQTAPAFIGNGSGLTSLPFPAGAATLGANTFTATQTISGGNLDIAGSITRSGAPLLHTPGVTNPSNNVAAGFNSLSSVTTGTNSVAIGSSAGANATTGSNNIYLGANVQGTAGDANTMYLGQPGVQTKAFIGGVRDVTTSRADATPVVIDSAGQLGTSPATFAVLGANTFTGTQTAPAFVGDGSGLTNLPFPAGAATLGANTFAGTQTAPLFIGSGAGLINLPFPAGAATLGANTFTATQTIHAGDLDLDPSTATAGNITKGGAPFLHNFGTSNTFLGVTAGNTTLTGSQNVGVGTLALHEEGSGVANTAIGYSSLQTNTGGGLNTATGWVALANTTSGSQNTASGAAALVSNSTGGVNTAVGSSALSSNTAGNNNVAIGASAGLNATTGSNNIYLGTNVGGVTGESNTMYLGKVGTQTRTIIAGVRGTTTVNPDAIPIVIDSAGQLGTISSSVRFKEDIHEMGDASRRLLRLRPVTFRYTQAYINGAKPIQYGLIAEEVAAVFPELAVRGADGHIETVHYETLNVLLLNELQKQQQRIESLEQKINDLLARLDR